MAFSVAAFGAAAATAAGAILKFESENVLQDGPSALLNPNPKGAVPSVAQAIARQTCRRYADGVPGLDEKTAVDLETVCRPYLDNIGYGEGPKLVKPFEGGQCDGQLYRVEFTILNPANGSTSVQPRVVWGPLGGVGLVPNSAGTSQTLNFTCRGAAVTSDCGSPPPLLPVPQSFESGSFPINRVLQNTSVSPCSGGDNCGNPPPVFTEPDPPPNPGPPTEPFNPDPDIDIDITVNLRPDSLIEVNFGLGPIVVPIFGGGGGDGGGGDGGGGGGGGGSGAPGAPEAGPEVPGGNGGFGGDDGFGPDPAGRRWVGACIRIIPPDNRQPPIPGSVPEDVYPTVVGNARLVYDAFGTRVVDTPVQIRAKGVCLWESVRGLNPVAVNVDLLPGWSYTYKPYSVPLEN